MRDWDDLRVFLAVSRLGGLSAAQQATGLSAATLGRRITSLEHDVGVPLFTRLQSGYRLTPAGEHLLARAEDVERAMAGVDHWSHGTFAQRSIRVSAGHWTTMFIAHNIDALWQPSDPAIEFVSANERIDIGHRAADIGVRNHRPQEQSLAGRRIGKVCFALYGTQGTGPEAPIVGLTGDTANTPSARWLAATYPDRIALKGNSVHAVRELAAKGAGLAVLPCFVGDSDPRVSRVGQIIDPLTTEQWLVAHHEERHLPATRIVIERLASLFLSNNALFAGQTNRSNIAP